jgi:capsid protein
VQPTWENFVLAAHLSGAAPIPDDVEPGTHDDALFIGQSMPWIDPVKEATAWLLLVKAGFASEVEVMRKRGVNPMDMLEQTATWRKKVEEKGLVFDSNAANEFLKTAVAAAIAD